LCLEVTAEDREPQATGVDIETTTDAAHYSFDSSRPHTSQIAAMTIATAIT